MKNNLLTTRLDFEHIIWDWNGTLLDDLDLVVEITNGMLARRGRASIDRDYYRNFFGFPVMDFYTRMGFDFSPGANSEPYDNLVAEFATEYEYRCRSCKLHDGAAGVLEQLNKSGIGQSILSATDQDFLVDTVKSFGIANYFKEIAGLDNKRAGVKLGSGQQLVESLGLPAEKIVLIGDTVHDCEVAAALGIECLIVLNGYNSPERFQKLPAITYSSLKEIML